MTHQADEEWAALGKYADRPPWHQWTQDGESTEFRREMHSHTFDISEPVGSIEIDSDFRIAIPLSGGLDSSTCYEMALDAGLPVVPYYVDTGASYSKQERLFLEQRNIIHEIIHLPLSYQRDGVIDKGRNAVILFTIAMDMARQGQWGEIWFGGHLGPAGEAPIRGGDKSHRFLLTFNQLLARKGYDVGVCRPMATMTKADMVAWWMEYRTTEDALDTWSCFDPRPSESMDGSRCGHCNACFRWWAAFAAHGIPVHTMERLWAEPPDFPTKFLTMFDTDDDITEFAPARTQWLHSAVAYYATEVFP